MNESILSMTTVHFQFPIGWLVGFFLPSDYNCNHGDKPSCFMSKPSQSLKFPSSQKCVFPFVPSVVCLSFTVQNDVRAEE